MTSREEMCAQCDAYVAAVAARDIEAILKVFAPDATQEEPIGTAARIGHDGIRSFFAESAAVPFTVSRLGPITVSGRVAAFQIRVDFEGQVMAPMTSTDVVTFDEVGLIKSIVAIPDLAAHPDVVD
jgi:steroid Delta-isomerase